MIKTKKNLTRRDQDFDVFPKCGLILFGTRNFFPIPDNYYPGYNEMSGTYFCKSYPDMRQINYSCPVFSEQCEHQFTVGHACLELQKVKKKRTMRVNMHRRLLRLAAEKKKGKSIWSGD